jgi:hypothetical protein
MVSDIAEVAIILAVDVIAKFAKRLGRGNTSGSA